MMKNGWESLPLVHRAANELRGNILSEKLAPGKQIPTEEELCKLYDCSRTTVRNAVAILVNEGLLVKRRPYGTFVALRPLVAAVNRYMVSSLTGFRMDPGESSIETVIHDIRLIVPDEEVCQNLFILPSHRVCYLERVRVWSGVPALFLQNYIPESVCPDLCRELQEVDLTKCSLYDTIEQKMGLCPSFAKRWVQPAIANPKVAAALLIEVGSPLFLVRNTTYDTHYQIRDFYRCYVTERYSRLEMTISRDARQGPNDNITADQGGTK